MSETSDGVLQESTKKSEIHRRDLELHRVSWLSPRIKVPRLSSSLRLPTPDGRAARVPQSAWSPIGTTVPACVPQLSGYLNWGGVLGLDIEMRSVNTFLGDKEASLCS